MLPFLKNNSKDITLHYILTTCITCPKLIVSAPSVRDPVSPMSVSSLQVTVLLQSEIQQNCILLLSNFNKVIYMQIQGYMYGHSISPQPSFNYHSESSRKCSFKLTSYLRLTTDSAKAVPLSSPLFYIKSYVYF